MLWYYTGFMETSQSFHVSSLLSLALGFPEFTRKMIANTPNVTSKTDCKGCAFIWLLYFSIKIKYWYQFLKYVLFIWWWRKRDTQHTSGCQRTSWGSWSPPFTRCVLGIELRSTGLAEAPLSAELSFRPIFTSFGGLEIYLSGLALHETMY